MKHVLIVSAVLASLTSAGPAAAQSSQRLDGWLGTQFREVARNCLGSEHAQTNHPPERYIPRDVRQWPTISPSLSAQVPIHQLESVGAYFARVTHRPERGGVVTNLPSLGLPFAESEATTLYPRRTNGVRQHNCATLLAASGDISIGMNNNLFRTALQSSVNVDQSEALFLYSGRIFSPFSAAFGQVTESLDARPGIDRLAVYLSVWHWYRQNPRMTVEGEDQRLHISRWIDAVATTKVSGLNQATMMSGTAAVSGAIPLLSASGALDTSVRERIVSSRQTFGVAILDSGAVALPGPRLIAEHAAAMARPTPASTNVTEIENDAAVQWAADLHGVPTGLCDTVFWTLQPSSGTASGFTYSNLAVAPVPGAANVCRYSVRATPKPTTDASGSNVATLAFAVMSRLPDSPLPNAPDLVVAMPETDLVDQRVSISLLSPTGGLSLVRPQDRNATLPMNLSYVVQENGSRRVSDVVQAGTVVDLSCGRDGTQPLSLSPSELSFARAGGQGRITLRADIPVGLLQGAEPDVTSCRLTGRVRVGVSGSQPRTLSLPGHNFTIKAQDAS